MEIDLPYNFEPRDYQVPLWSAFDDGYKRIMYVWHRRAGKDINSINLLARAMYQRVGTYFYLFPTYKQGKKILWNGMNKDGFKFLHYIPPELVVRKDNTEMILQTTNGSMMQVIGTDNMDCYDDETEILTKDGWKYFKDIEKDEVVATLSEDNNLEYHTINERVSYNYEGEMYKVKSKAMDLLVTPNHKFYVESRKGQKKFKVISNETIINDAIPSTCSWLGKIKKTFLLPSVERSKNDHHSLQNQEFDMKDWCMFLGIYLSEGSVYKTKSGDYRVYITQKDEDKGGVKGNVYEKIKDLLDRMGLKYSYDGKSFLINNRELHLYLKQFGNVYEKHVPREILELDKEYLQCIFDWLVYGDGSIQKHGQVDYYSTSKQLIDDVQELIIKLGYSGNIRVKQQKPSYINGRKIETDKPMYQITLRKSKYKRFCTSKESYISKEEYRGKVYCVDVKNHVIKVRRNGFETWCGNSIVGTNPVGCVFSEYSLQNPAAWDFISPILAENGGWAIFEFTPRGENHAYDLLKYAENNKNWFTQVLTVEDTKAIPRDILEEERMNLMQRYGDDAFYQQEYMCSFNAPLQGAYYATQLQQAESDGRITKVPHDSATEVHTSWDLGMDDSTTIWFFQVCGREIHFIDYLEESGEGLQFYVEKLKEKKDAGKWIYGKHYLPHDVEVREMGTGKSRRQTLQSLGITNIKVVPRIPSIQHGIQQVRNILSRCWFDRENCKTGINAMKAYKKEYDEKNQVYKSRPLHDWSSHAADGFRTFACGYKDIIQQVVEHVPMEFDPYD